MSPRPPPRPAEAAPPATTATALPPPLPCWGEGRGDLGSVKCGARARLVDDVGLAPEDDRDAALARALLLR